LLKQLQTLRQDDKKNTTLDEDTKERLQFQVGCLLKPVLVNLFTTFILGTMSFSSLLHWVSLSLYRSVYTGKIVLCKSYIKPITYIGFRYKSYIKNGKCIGFSKNKAFFIPKHEDKISKNFKKVFGQKCYFQFWTNF
jgi:hypothetical protein